MNKSHFNKAFGEYLKTVRVSSGMTQFDLAIAMNINPQNISAIERGEVTPTLFWIHNLCVALKIDHKEFIQGFYSRV